MTRAETEITRPTHIYQNTAINPESETIPLRKGAISTRSRGYRNGSKNQREVEKFLEIFPESSSFGTAEIISNMYPDKGPKLAAPAASHLIAMVNYFLRDKGETITRERVGRQVVFRRTKTDENSTGSSAFDPPIPDTNRTISFPTESIHLDPIIKRWNKLNKAEKYLRDIETTKGAALFQERIYKAKEEQTLTPEVLIELGNRRRKIVEDINGKLRPRLSRLKLDLLKQGGQQVQEAVVLFEQGYISREDLEFIAESAIAKPNPEAKLEVGKTPLGPTASSAKEDGELETFSPTQILEAERNITDKVVLTEADQERIYEEIRNNGRFFFDVSKVMRAIGGKRTPDSVKNVRAAAHQLGIKTDQQRGPLNFTREEFIQVTTFLLKREKFESDASLVGSFERTGHQGPVDAPTESEAPEKDAIQESIDKVKAERLKQLREFSDGRDTLWLFDVAKATGFHFTQSASSRLREIAANHGAQGRRKVKLTPETFEKVAFDFIEEKYTNLEAVAQWLRDNPKDFYSSTDVLNASGREKYVGTLARTIRDKASMLGAGRSGRESKITPELVILICAQIPAFNPTRAKSAAIARANLYQSHATFNLEGKDGEVVKELPIIADARERDLSISEKELLDYLKSHPQEQSVSRLKIIKDLGIREGDFFRAINKLRILFPANINTVTHGIKSGQIFWQDNSRERTLEEEKPTPTTKAAPEKPRPIDIRWAENRASAPIREDDETREMMPNEARLYRFLSDETPTSTKDIYEKIWPGAPDTKRESRLSNLLSLTNRKLFSFRKKIINVGTLQGAAYIIVDLEQEAEIRQKYEKERENKKKKSQRIRTHEQLITLLRESRRDFQDLYVRFGMKGSAKSKTESLSRIARKARAALAGKGETVVDVGGAYEIMNITEAQSARHRKPRQTSPERRDEIKTPARAEPVRTSETTGERQPNHNGAIPTMQEGHVFLIESKPFEIKPVVDLSKLTFSDTELLAMSGTFKNPAVLELYELKTGKPLSSSDIENVSFVLEQAFEHASAPDNDEDRKNLALRVAEKLEYIKDHLEEFMDHNNNDSEIVEVVGLLLRDNDPSGMWNELFEETVRKLPVKKDSSAENEQTGSQEGQESSYALNGQQVFVLGALLRAPAARNTLKRAGIIVGEEYIGRINAIMGAAVDQEDRRKIISQFRNLLPSIFKTIEDYARNKTEYEKANGNNARFLLRFFSMVALDQPKLHELIRALEHAYDAPIPHSMGSMPQTTSTIPPETLKWLKK